MKGIGEIERHLEEQRRSGKSAVEYCRERGISIGKFYSWRKRNQQNAPSGFARVQTTITVQIEVSGVKVHVPLEALNVVLSELSKR
jgi:hypothetical protein